MGLNTLPADGHALLATLQHEVQAILGHDLVGMYVRGSLALGDFIPATSDIDVLTATEQPVDAATFAALHMLHIQLDALPNSFAGRLECTYIDRAALRRFTPSLRHPSLGQGEQLSWTEHGTNWIIERWTVREHGVTLLGPPPTTLIDPIDATAIITAVRDRLPDWLDFANQTDDPQWNSSRSHKAYIVETMCRMRYTLTQGGLCSKPQAVAWARTNLPEPWPALVERSQTWRKDHTNDLTINPEVQAFVRWVGSRE